jgi:hypothetical protein
MGLSNSKKNRAREQQHYIEDMEELQRIAARAYHYRLQNYNPYKHGPYGEYLYDVEAQYELDCLPECVKYSENHPNHPRNRR